jgi:hypothetical protein
MLSPELKEILRCPKCRGPLTELSAPEGLHCESCRLLYPIVEGIPNMLVDEAQPLKQPGLST